MQGHHEQHSRKRRSRDPIRTEKANMRIYVKNEQLSVRFSPRIPALGILQGTLRPGHVGEGIQ